ncbi:MAG: hypothetical protein AAF416_17050 [Pseudomonadota bacterium]
MARYKRALGPNAYALIEGAPPALVMELLAPIGGEPDLRTAIDVSSAEDPKTHIIEALSGHDAEDLKPFEQRCRSVLFLAEGKATASINTIANERLCPDDHAEYERQPDALCRSGWLYLGHPAVFQDAESFHFARRHRDNDKLYDAFELEDAGMLPVDAAGVDEAALAEAVTEALDLKTRCSVRAIALPKAEGHPPSIMLVVRHGGPLSSVADHRDDGARATIYFRPANEATLIFTPKMRQIEICAESPRVRQMIAGCFAEKTLGQDLSKKPLTWKHYDLGRFRRSLELPVPEVEGFDVQAARLIELELRLGNWQRKLSLKVAFEDDISEVSDRYLGQSSIVRTADGFSRIVIAARYGVPGEKKLRTLKITISGTRRCNLQSMKDPLERQLGFSLLEAWGIMSRLKPLDERELRQMLPTLLEMLDRTEDTVTGSYLREHGLDRKRLVAAGLLHRDDRQDIVLIEGDETEHGEIVLSPSATPGMVRVTSPFGEDLGDRPSTDFDRFRLNATWLHEEIVGLVKPLLSTASIEFIDPDLTLLGTMDIDGTEVPLYMARRLHVTKTVARLNDALRSRSNLGIGLVLDCGASGLSHLAANVVTPLGRHLLDGDGAHALSAEDLAFSFRGGQALARGGESVALVQSGAQVAVLRIPGKPTYTVVGANRVLLVQRLVDAFQKGAPGVATPDLLEGFRASGPSQVFGKEWAKVQDVYIRHAGPKLWKLDA